MKMAPTGSYIIVHRFKREERAYGSSPGRRVHPWISFTNIVKFHNASYPSSHSLTACMTASAVMMFRFELFPNKKAGITEFIDHTRSPICCPENGFQSILFKYVLGTFGSLKLCFNIVASFFFRKPVKMIIHDDLLP